MKVQVVCADSLAWLAARRAASIHAIVTDPPYGVREYSAKELQKLRRGRGGVWRQPPTLGGSRRAPLPRFTVLTPKDRAELVTFFERFAAVAMHALVPGAHLVLASQPLLDHEVWGALCRGGFEKRGVLVRLVQTLRGGDRPKGAEREFEDLTVMPRSQWEPWGIFRKPCEGTVRDNLRRWRTGALRRPTAARPFGDVMHSTRTPARERSIAPHPSLKPQSFLRPLVRAVLPFGEGTLVDPFCGGGSTLGAALAVGYDAIGIERDPDFARMAERAIPALAALP